MEMNILAHFPCGKDYQLHSATVLSTLLFVNLGGGGETWIYVLRVLISSRGCQGCIKPLKAVGMQLPIALE